MASVDGVPIPDEVLMVALNLGILQYSVECGVPIFFNDELVQVTTYHPSGKMFIANGRMYHVSEGDVIRINPDLS